MQYKRMVQLDEVLCQRAQQSATSSNLDDSKHKGFFPHALYKRRLRITPRVTNINDQRYPAILKNGLRKRVSPRVDLTFHNVHGRHR